MDNAIKQQRTVRLAPHGPLGVQIQHTSPSEPPVTLQIVLALAASRGKVLDVFFSWDSDGSGRVTREVFHDAMRALGVEGSAARSSLQGK